MLDILKVIFLGIIEGVTEWLPISSTGHMILVDHFMKLNVSDEFREMFLVVIQLGAIIAVAVLFRHILWPFHRPRKTAGGLTRVANRKKLILWLKIFISCLPAAVIGLLLDDWLNAHFYNSIVVSVMLILYGGLFILVEKRRGGRSPAVSSLTQIDYLTALLIGVFQVLALIPGTSRSGATILGGILLGLSRTKAAEYTFFLAVPVMAGASLLKMIKFGFHYTGTEAAYLMIGTAVSFLVSMLVIRFLMAYIRKRDFRVFGWYRIALGAAVLICFAATGV